MDSVANSVLKPNSGAWERVGVSPGLPSLWGRAGRWMISLSRGSHDRPSVAWLKVFYDYPARFKKLGVLH